MPPGVKHRRSRRWVAPAAVLAGGLLGSLGRSVIASAFPATPDAFPLATLVINLSGSLLLGLYLARRQRSVASRQSLQFWAIGMLGSFTTFAAFSLETFRLIEAAQAPSAVGYAAASTLGGLAVALLGDRLGSALS